MRRRLPWRALCVSASPAVSSTFVFDVLACPRCGGRLRLIALIDEAAVIGRLLRHLGLPTDLPVARPARAPPLLDVASEE